MAARRYDLWGVSPTQATKAFTEMKAAAVDGDIDATVALANYAALTQVVARLDAILEALAPKNESSTR